MMEKEIFAFLFGGLVGFVSLPLYLSVIIILFGGIWIWSW